MNKSSVILLIIIAIWTGAVTIAADSASQNKGAEIILINGGKMRDVHFPHHRHQSALADCNVCHELFPARAGSIAELKEQGKLKKKEVMEKHCIACHKQRKAAGRNTGPTSCARCHRKTG